MATEKSKKQSAKKGGPQVKMKGSGVEWLGKVPKGWEVRRLKYAAILQKGRAVSNQEQDNFSDGLPLLSMDYLRGKEGERSLLPSTDDTLAQDGDILILWDGANAGEFLKAKEGVLSSTLCKVRIIKKKYKSFFFYALVSAQSYIQSECIGMGIPHVDGKSFKMLKIPLPPLPEQKTITNFLDQKTVRIDQLIKKKERMIELLQEKRNALISHAVTKGLDPKAPLKDSGVEWLGKVPKRWEVRRLKYATSINDETLSEETDPAFEISYVDISNVELTRGIINTENMLFGNAPSRARRVVRDGDTIVSTVRTYLKAIAPIYRPIPNMVVSTGFAVIRPRTVNPVFISYLMRSNRFIETVVAHSTGVSYPAINASKIGTFQLPLPPLPEQKAIADFLDKETQKIDQLIEKTKAAIDLLKEGRSSLISHAVTGQIAINQEA